MRVLFILITVISLAGGCAQAPAPLPINLDIVEILPNKETAMTKQNMLHLTQVYDLAPFLFTTRINIQSQTTRRSHPVLTLNTHYHDAPEKILSAWLHEELHWWTSKKVENTQLAINELKKIYPRAPKTGALGMNSTYLKLIICYLEFRSVSHFLGDKEAARIIKEMVRKDKRYPWIYNQVLHKSSILKKIITKYKLLPPPLEV